LQLLVTCTAISDSDTLMVFLKLRTALHPALKPAHGGLPRNFLNIQTRRDIETLRACGFVNLPRRIISPVHHCLLTRDK